MKIDRSVPLLKKINFITGLCFLALAVVYLITGIYSIVQSHHMQDTNEEVTLACIEYADMQAGLEAGTERMQRHMITAILAANEEARQSSLSEYNASVESLNAQLDTLEARMRDAGAEGVAAVLSSLRENLTAYIEVCGACISASNINRQVAFDMTLNNLPEPKTALDASFDELTSLISQIEQQGMEQSSSMMRSSRNMTIGGIIAFLLVVIASVFILVALVTAPLRRLSDELSEMIDGIRKKQGDLSRRIDVKSNNEIGGVVAGINEYVETLQIIMQKLKSNAESLSETSEAISAQMREANGSVDRSGAAMEQVSSAMRSVTDTAEGISAGLKEVRSSVEQMSERTGEGSKKASSVMLDAQRIRREATEKKQHTGRRIEELNEVLKRSVENSAQVNQIGKLTDNILSIASQTNLLSLNASIEAARAGEAGRGFAVVAEEISSLADDSASTASDIQAISKSVTDAVQELSENAIAVIDFISDVVLKDYDAFVDTGDAYEQSVKSFNEMLKSLTDSARQLDEAMQTMDSAVNAIEESVDASSRSLDAAESSAGEIAGSISDVNALVETNQSISAALNHEVGRFARL